MIPSSETARPLSLKESGEHRGPARSAPLPASSHGRGTERLCWIVGALGLSSAAWRWYASLGNYPLLFDHPSGTWATLATDLVAGEFYRPLLSQSGYGGTRYFPLNLLAQAALIRSGLSPAMSGHVLALLGASALALGVYSLVRRSGASAVLSASAAGMALGTLPVQWSVTITRGDLLPAALMAHGLGFAQAADGHIQRRLHVLLASACLALAVLAKPTALFALLGALLALTLERQYRLLASLAALTSVAVTLGLMLTNLASAGRWLESLHACATGGTPVWRLLLTSPAKLLINGAPIDLALACLAAGVMLASPRRRDVISMAWLSCALATVAVFGSPGIGENHLLDLCVLSISLVLSRNLGQMRLAHFCLASFAALSIAYATLRIGATSAAERFAVVGDARTLIARVSGAIEPPSRGPLLAENPWIPLFLGERPFLLDAFTLRVQATRDPAVAGDLATRLGRREFRAVVLMKPVEEARWYEGAHFGRGFSERLLRDYALVAAYTLSPSSSTGIYVYLPRAPP